MSAGGAETLDPLHRRWLIAIAFWLSKGFIKSGLGNRIDYNIVSLFGKTTLAEHPDRIALPRITAVQA